MDTRIDTIGLTPPPDLAGAAMHALTTRKTVEYLYATATLGAGLGAFESGVAGYASDPSLRWTLIEYRTDPSDIDRELSRYISLGAPKAIVEARRALADAKAVHLTDVGSLEFDLDDAERRWSNGCRQKVQALRVKLTETRNKTLPDTQAPHFFIYLAADSIASDGPSPKRLRARNYLGSWLLEDNLDVDIAEVASAGWPLPAFQRWIQALAALRRKPSREDAHVAPSDCVLAASEGRCYAMDLQTFTRLDVTT
jgi:hypothetical protein